MNYAPKETKEYLDWAFVQSAKALDIIAVDQAKFNLTWLIFPEIDTHGLEVVPDAYVTALHSFMDKETRAALGSAPLDFVGYWAEIDNGEISLALTAGMPEDYMARMVIQAHKAQARMVMNGVLPSPSFIRHH